MDMFRTTMQNATIKGKWREEDIVCLISSLLGELNPSWPWSSPRFTISMQKRVFAPFAYFIQIMHRAYALVFTLRKTSHLLTAIYLMFEIQLLISERDSWNLFMLLDPWPRGPSVYWIPSGVTKWQPSVQYKLGIIKVCLLSLSIRFVWQSDMRSPVWWDISLC